MVGRARVELATSRLSGVRSNHLSYRPPPRTPIKVILLRGPASTGQKAAGGKSQLRHITPNGVISRMKGHEDDGMFFENGRSSSDG